MKVFQIGFNRCGTTSIYELFENIKKVHYWIPSNEIDIPQLKNHEVRLEYFNGVLDARKYLLITDIIKFNKQNNNKLLEGIDDDYILFCDLEDSNTNYQSYIKDYKTLDEQYPGSKFILNTRDIDKWLQSRINHDTYLDDCKRVLNLNEEQVIALWKKQWFDHHKDVFNYFKDRDNLIIFDIEKDSVDDLIEFNLDINKWQRHNKSFK